jgi:chemosensory pili system protein ChpA (sensor histidine kinase/response regulator)
MSQDKEQELQIQFLQESHNNLNIIESVLLEVKNNSRLNIKDINNALRAAHSIKGGAGLMRLYILSDLAHKLEDAFKVLKTQKDLEGINAVQILLKSVDWLRKIVNASFEENNQALEQLINDCLPVFEQLYDILGDAAEEDATTILAPEDGLKDVLPLMFQTQVEGRLQYLESRLEEPEGLQQELIAIARQLSGLGQMFDLEPFTQLCESITTRATEANTDAEVVEIAHSALSNWRRSQALILGHSQEKPEVIVYSDNLTTKPPTPVSSPLPQQESDNIVRVSTRQLDEINNLSGELTIERHSLNLQLEQLHQLIRHLHQQLQNLDTESNSNIDVYNAIAKLKETTTDITISLEDTTQVNRSLNKTAQHLQHCLTQVLMRPLGDILERFPRAIRDLSMEYGKQVQLKITGAETSIERNILENLQEPLMHLLRNAFDHGIEDPDVRRSCGKSEQGLIEITAVYQHNRITITVRDDGAGISLEKIRDRALAMGLDQTLLAQANKEELLSLIFEPGFSTKEQVTTLSGRGIGMDVVRSNLKQIQGDIKVDTQPGRGTSFTLSVPLSLSVLRVLIIESQQMILACPCEVITAVFLQEQAITEAGKEFIDYQGDRLQLFRLSEYLKFNCLRYDQANIGKTPAIDAKTILIINQGQPIAVQVDRCWNEQEIVIRPVESNIPLPPGFSNCTIIGDGRVVPLVIFNELFYTGAKLEFLPLPIRQQPLALPSKKSTILLIDDSIYVRRFLANNLEKAGYFVEQAKDGLDAIAKLQTLSVDAIICDIDMPRLDGYGFLERLKSLPELKHIPVTILSSQRGDRHRQLAMQLGAQAYLYKPYNEYELLQVLKQMM